MIMGGTLPWHVVIDKYTATVLNNTTSIGFRGEVAAQILCLAAWQKCLGQGSTSQPELSFPFVPALDFIKKLVGLSSTLCLRKCKVG
jgi:hypothetical protein